MKSINRIQSILESDVMRRNAFDTAKIQKRNFSNRIYLNHFMAIYFLISSLGNFGKWSFDKNSSRFATGKLVTSIGIKETEKDSVTQEKGTKLFSFDETCILLILEFKRWKMKIW
ncbi:hypothetical protein Avbf_15782 [Armadillidium vulgare]|nr:hypothetical protein Avbf_15782 [Armadillidium vulgare]